MSIALASIATYLAKNGLELIGKAVLKKGKEYVEEKTGISLGEDMSSADLLALKKFQTENQTELEKIAQENLTSRHQADMASDSWLSKNIRPLCLLAITCAIVFGVFLPEELVDADKFRYLTDMSQWVYGYYFVGRSTFDKGNIKMRFGKVSE
jgi:hypothetical protein